MTDFFSMYTVEEVTAGKELMFCHRPDVKLKQWESWDVLSNFASQMTHDNTQTGDLL